MRMTGIIISVDFERGAQQRKLTAAISAASSVRIFSLQYVNNFSTLALLVNSSCVRS